MKYYKTLSKSNEFYLPREQYLAAFRYALQYKLWKAELSVEPDTSRAVSYDGDRVQTSGGYDVTVETAIRRVELQHKVDTLEQTVREVAPEFPHFLLMGVAYGFTFYQLKDMGMPVERTSYYAYRRKFYFEYSKKI